MSLNMRAALVGVDFGKDGFADSLEELSLLAQSAGADVVTTITCKRSGPDAALFIGSGKADEVLAVADSELDLSFLITLYLRLNKEILSVVSKLA
jgi:GTP-binding protein HflX